MNFEFTRTVLENEFAVIYAYGVIAARIGYEYKDLAINSLILHRKNRDQLIDYLLSHNQTLPVAEISYTVDPITDNFSGARVGQAAEKQSCQAYRNLIAQTVESDLKDHALHWLISSTHILSSWESIIHRKIFVEPFPGS